MRSRYAAYVLNLPAYIIETTHPASPQYQTDLHAWTKDISTFSHDTKFEKLEIFDFQERGHLATVTFTAHLSQKGKNSTFTEKSFFEKRRGRWFYRSGRLTEGHVPNLLTTSEMRLLPLAYYGEPILTKKAEPIAEIGQDLRKLIEEMVETMDACDGIGLAAPQIHHSIRLFVIRELLEGSNDSTELGDVKIFINPKIISQGKKTWKASEGCLSIPTIHAEVERPLEITVEYTDLEGQLIQETCSGWKARVILHEYDHIEGILFIDRLSPKKREQLEERLKLLRHRIHDGTEL
jgi:peptide deformylase